MFLEQQPDKRIYTSNGVFHITPVIDVNKFDPHNYNINQLIDLGETGLLQYKECNKAKIPSEYLTGCKNGLYKMHKALSYYSLVNEDARKLKADIEKELCIRTEEENKVNLNKVFSDVTRDNMQNKSVYANAHSNTYEPPMTEQQKKIYEKMMLPR